MELGEPPELALPLAPAVLLVVEVLGFCWDVTATHSVNSNPRCRMRMLGPDNALIVATVSYTTVVMFRYLELVNCSGLTVTLQGRELCSEIMHCNLGKCE